MEFEIGQKFIGIYPPEAAVWCNQNDAHIEQLPQVHDGESVREYIIVENPKPTDEEIKADRIAELKRLLADSDYIVIKIAEGVATHDDYSEILNSRKAWREELNELGV